MSDVTHILSQIESGDPSAAHLLLPLVYDELRKLAAARLARERPGQTLQATARVHEAYLRLAGHEQTPGATRWKSRGHFFAAAAEAMRRILVENARRKQRQKRGGDRVRQDLPLAELADPEPPEDLLALDEALERLADADRMSADLVRLRFFAGLTSADATAILGLPPRSADRRWAYARAWLHRELADSDRDDSNRGDCNQQASNREDI